MRKRWLCLPLLLLSHPQLVPLPEETRPPNFVLVFVDDVGYGDIGAFGAATIKTPHLDRMAAEGVKLTSFYASASVCTPSRGGLLTGRYPIRLELVRDVARPTNTIGLAAEEITLAEVLKERGYQTACIGKWHLGHAPEQWPTRQGFDYFYGLPYSNDMRPLALYRMDEKIEEPVDQATLTERYTAEAIRFIEEHQEDPFFVYLPHTMAHVPLFVSERFQGRSQAGLYGDVIEALDWSVGEILATLQRLDLDEETLVLFTSDNGPWWEGSPGPFRGRKGTAWDGGMRMPFVARWPGRIPPGVVSDGISMNIDLFPTFIELAGGEIPDDRPIDGRNIWDLLQGGQVSPHEALYLFDKEQIAAVRTQDWKLVAQSWYRGWSIRIGAKTYHYYPGLLFDVRNDPEERYSLTGKYPEIAQRLAAWLEEGERALK